MRETHKLMKWTTVYGWHDPVICTQTYCFQSLQGKLLKWTLGRSGSVKVVCFWKRAFQALLKCKYDLWTFAYLLLWNASHHLKKDESSIGKLDSTNRNLSLSQCLSLVWESALSHNAKHLFFFSLLKGLDDWLKEPLCSQWEVCCHAVLVVFGVTYQPPHSQPPASPKTHTNTSVPMRAVMT